MPHVLHTDGSKRTLNGPGGHGRAPQRLTPSSEKPPLRFARNTFGGPNVGSATLSSLAVADYDIGHSEG